LEKNFSGDYNLEINRKFMKPYNCNEKIEVYRAAYSPLFQTGEMDIPVDEVCRRISNTASDDFQLKTDFFGLVTVELRLFVRL